MTVCKGNTYQSQFTLINHWAVIHCYIFFHSAVTPLTFITEHGRLDVNESVIYDDSWRMTV